MNPNLESTMTEFWNRCEGQPAGSYLLVKHLSGSANSAFYAAVSGQDTQPFAIKLLQIDGAERERQLSEWSALVPWSHPNLIRVFEAGQCEIDGVPLLYLVMERADGDLGSVLPEHTLTALEAYETLDPALRALAYLHGQGYVLGGLKPSRVLAIGEVVKLSSACITRSGQTHRQRTPTVYDPPEWQEGVASPEGDVWSLGATLVQALTQNPPEPDPGGADPRVSANMPEPFLTIARNCLSRDPRARWTVAQIASHLHGPQPVALPTPVSPEREPPRSRMSFYWIAAAAMVAITLLVLLVRDRRTPPTFPEPTPVTAAVPAPVPAPIPVPPSAPAAAPAPTEPISPPPSAIKRSGNWFVVVATYSRKEDAERRARTIERQSPPIKAEVYSPTRSAKPYFLVVIGSNLSQQEAIELRARAGRVAADSYLTTFNP